MFLWWSILGTNNLPVVKASVLKTFKVHYKRNHSKVNRAFDHSQLDHNKVTTLWSSISLYLPTPTIAILHSYLHVCILCVSVFQLYCFMLDFIINNVSLNLKKCQRRWNKPGVSLTTSVCHTVKEEPGVRIRAIFDKWNIVTGVNAENSKQLHGVSGHRGDRGRVERNLQSFRGVALSCVMTVNLV